MKQAEVGPGHPESALPFRDFASLVSFCALAVAAVLVTHAYQFPGGDHTVQVPPILRLLDPTLYPRDYFVEEMLRFTPRCYYNWLVFAGVWLGLGVPGTYLALHLIALSAFLAGLVGIARTLQWSWSATAILIGLVFGVVAGRIGAVTSIMTNTPVPSTLAMGTAIWGIHHAFKRRWIVSFAFFGLTCLLQFLVGLLPAVLLTPLLLRDVTARRRVFQGLGAFLVLGLGAGAIYLPMVLSGTTSTDLLSTREFVRLYAEVRHPHHLVPSAWPLRDWINLLGFYSGGLWLLRLRPPPRVPIGAVQVVVVVSGVALLANWMFVEVLPSAFTAKLQLARMTPFAQLGILIALVDRIDRDLSKGHYLVGAILVAALLVRDGGMLLAILAVILGVRARPSPRWAPGASITAATAVAGFALYQSIPLRSPLVWADSILEGPVLLGLLFFPTVLTVYRPVPRRTSASALAVLLLLVVAFAGSGMLPDRVQQIVAKKGSFDGELAPDSSISAVAARASTELSRNSLILIPPSQAFFRMASRRSVVVDNKAFPYTDAGIVEWRERMEAVLGSDLERPGRYQDRTPTELTAVARRYGADYILTRRSWHSSLGEQPVIAEGDWAIWKVDS